MRDQIRSDLFMGNVLFYIDQFDGFFRLRLRSCFLLGDSMHFHESLENNNVTNNECIKSLPFERS